MSAAYAAPSCLLTLCICCFSPRRLPRDPPAADDGAAQVPPGEARGAEGLLPAAQRHPGGALQEGRGEERSSLLSLSQNQEEGGLPPQSGAVTPLNGY